MLQWHLNWDGLKKRCGAFEKTLAANREIMFNIKGKEKYSNHNDNISEYYAQPDFDILQVPECPALGGVYEITQSTAPSACPTITTYDDDTSPHGNPCAIKVDKAMASSISSHAASLIVPTPTPMPWWQREQSSSGVAGVVRPTQPALAVACLVGGMILASCV